MQWLGANYARDLYRPELKYLLSDGDQVGVRGRTTAELLNFVSEVWEPWHHCILIPSRQWNPWLALSEFLWIMAGRDDTESLLPFNSHIVDYSDHGDELYGAYGKRIYHQIDPMIERLKADPSDRRAVLQIWGANSPRPYFTTDLVAQTKDPPCNNLVYFKLRENKLHMTVINRSNDIHFGLFAVNLPTFGMLQGYVAARLGVEQGTQSHFSNSLHVYLDDKRATRITERMEADEKPLPLYPNHAHLFDDPFFRNLKGHAAMATLSACALDGEDLDVYPPFLQFAKEFLDQYRKKAWDPKDLAYHEQYADWVAAGEMFVDKIWK